MIKDRFSLQFLGAAGTVTGSKFLLSYGTDQILLDCGLFQGLKELRLRNWASLPINVKDLRAVILTHAHIDHSGYLPKLVKLGACPSNHQLFCRQVEEVMFSMTHGKNLP